MPVGTKAEILESIGAGAKGLTAATPASSGLDTATKIIDAIDRFGNNKTFGKFIDRALGRILPEAGQNKPSLLTKPSEKTPEPSKGIPPEDMASQLPSGVNGEGAIELLQGFIDMIPNPDAINLVQFSAWLEENKEKLGRNIDRAIKGMNKEEKAPPKEKPKK